MSIKKTTEEFVKQAQIKHGNKYDYSKVDYKGYNKKIIIICSIHDNFEQLPVNHLRGSRCPKCTGNFMNTEYFKEKAVKVHGDKYDYSKVNYTKNQNKVIIICKIHKEFEQTANDHLTGSNCPKCMNNFMNTEYFKEKATKVHGNKYDYSKVNYINTESKVTIICKIHKEFEQIANSHLMGSNCPKCTGNFMDKNYFIEKANKIHNNKYDYSKVNEINYKIKIPIICKIHGSFFQKINGHLSGQGCSKCSGKFMNTEYFIEKANKIHNNKYDYSLVNYKNSETKVTIICKIHGNFVQAPGDHLSKRGCSKCVGNFMNTEYFIEKANKIHNNKYDYSKVNYVNSTTKIIIICPKHKKFEQLPGDHLAKCGCPKCGKNFMNTEYFIEKANKIHNNKYDYSKVNYVNTSTKIIIKCNKHNEFEQTPNAHLSGKGCSKCCLNLYSNMAINYLNFMSKYYNIKIQHALNGGEFLIPETKYKADGYCKKSNTVYEFHGSKFHGAPSIYDPNEMTFLGKTHKELYKKTIKKENKIKDLGYNLVVMWEHDWKKINKSIKLLQKKFKARKNK